MDLIDDALLFVFLECRLMRMCWERSSTTVRWCTPTSSDSRRWELQNRISFFALFCCYIGDFWVHFCGIYSIIWCYFLRHDLVKNLGGFDADASGDRDGVRRRRRALRADLQRRPIQRRRGFLNILFSYYFFIPSFSQNSEINISLYSNNSSFF